MYKQDILTRNLKNNPNVSQNRKLSLEWNPERWKGYYELQQLQWPLYLRFPL